MSKYGWKGTTLGILAGMFGVGMVHLVREAGPVHHAPEPEAPLQQTTIIPSTSAATGQVATTETLQSYTIPSAAEWQEQVKEPERGSIPWPSDVHLQTSPTHMLDKPNTLESALPSVEAQDRLAIADNNLGTIYETQGQSLILDQIQPEPQVIYTLYAGASARIRETRVDCQALPQAPSLIPAPGAIGGNLPMPVPGHTETHDLSTRISDPDAYNLPYIREQAGTDPLQAPPQKPRSAAVEVLKLQALLDIRNADYGHAESMLEALMQLGELSR